MHLYVIARGIQDRLDRWVNDLLAIYYPYEYEKGKPLGKVQLSVRPVQLYEIVFPEKELNEVLATINPKWVEKDLRYNLMAAALRKALGAEGIFLDDIKPNDKLYRDFVGVIPIGIKKDRWIDGIEQL